MGIYRDRQKKIEAKRKSRFENLTQVRTISKSSPYWKNIEPGTIIKFVHQSDAIKAIKEGYANPINDIIMTDDGLLL